MTDPLSLVTPLPAPHGLPPSYDRHAPEPDALRPALSVVVGGLDWARCTWSELVEGLLAVGRTDVPLARLAEGHIDAVRTADQAGAALVDGALYGVWASRSGGTGVRAETAGGLHHDDTQRLDQTLRLSGTLRFASGAGLLDRALLPVELPDGSSRLLDLPATDLPVDAGAWRTSAMAVSRSHTVRLDDHQVPARLVGDAGFYLERPGFFPGGVGVAAVWAGGLARVADTLPSRRRSEGQPLHDARLGRLRTELVVAAAVVREAGRRLDVMLTPDGRLRDPVATDPTLLRLLATEARAAVADAVERGLEHVRVLAGPAGLALDADLTHAVDDLALYLRQRPTDADAAALGQRWGSGGAG